MHTLFHSKSAWPNTFCITIFQYYTDVSLNSGGKILHWSIQISFLTLALDIAAAEMLMPRKNWIAIYELLFKERVMVARKDAHMPKYLELGDQNVPNLYIMKALQCLK